MSEEGSTKHKTKEDEFGKLVENYKVRKDAIEKILEEAVIDVNGIKSIGFVDFTEEVTSSEIPVVIPPTTWIELEKYRKDVLVEGSYLLTAEPRKGSLILCRVKEIIRPKPIEASTVATIGINARLDLKFLIRNLKLVLSPMVSLLIDEEDIAKAAVGSDVNIHGAIKRSQRVAPSYPPDQLSFVGIPRSDVLEEIFGLKGEVVLGTLGIMDQPMEGITVKLPWDLLVKHVLITGTTGAGKTSFLKNVLYNITTGAEEAFQVVIDANGDFAVANFPGYIKEDKITRRVVKALTAYGVIAEVGKSFPPSDKACNFKLNNLLVTSFSLSDHHFLYEFLRFLAKNKPTLFNELIDHIDQNDERLAHALRKIRDNRNALDYVERIVTSYRNVIFEYIVNAPFFVDILREAALLRAIMYIYGLVKDMNNTYAKLGAPITLNIIDIESIDDSTVKGIVKVADKSGKELCDLELIATARTLIVTPESVNDLLIYYPHFSPQAREILLNNLAPVAEKCLAHKNFCYPKELYSPLKNGPLKSAQPSTKWSVERGLERLTEIGVILTKDRYVYSKYSFEFSVLFNTAKSSNKSGIVLDLGEALDDVRKISIGLTFLDSFIFEVERIKDFKYFPVVIDEAHLFFPPSKDESDKRMHMLVNKLNEMVRLGRRRGIAVFMSTHRPADVHPVVLSLTNTKIYFRNDKTVIEKLEIPKEYAEKLPAFGDYAALLESYAIWGKFITFVNGPALVGHKTV